MASKRYDKKIGKALLFMDKIKVLHILNTGSYSGAENVVITIIKHMETYVDGIYLSPDGNIRNYLEENNISFYPVKKLNIPNLKRAIHKIQPDILHAHDFTAGIVSAFSTRKIPIINHIHNTPPWLKRPCLKSMAYGISCTRYNWIFTVSSSILHEYIFGKYIATKSTMIGNPFHAQMVREKSKLSGLNIPSDIVFLGRFSKQKNPFLFIEIIKDLTRSLPDIQAIMVGGGELYAQIETCIYELNLEKNITLYGFQENPYGLLNAGKVLCMPSLWEGLPIAALEALSLGKPVVASPAGGLTDIIDPSCGQICNSKEAFVNELYQLLTNATYYQSKCNRAHKRTLQLDDMPRYIQLIYKTYNSII